VKGHRNIVTETYVAAELRIIEILRAEYPSHAVLSEETAADTDASRGWTWVIDPIDGTKIYASGIPFWCTSTALCLDAAPVVALTYDAVHGGGVLGDRRTGRVLRRTAYRRVRKGGCVVRRRGH